MIRLEEIAIKEFRGIRDLKLNLKNNNFVICGSNGTGKSGIVDAIEFALTGGISRLSGAGTGGISVKDHGPHVDSRNNPEKASVTLKFTVMATKKNATIHRTVKNANKPVVTPDSPETQAALQHVAAHPEFVLSRRELIKYVLAEAGKRSQEVQALLRLEELESFRKLLQKISNAESKSVPILKNEKTNAGDQLARALGIARLTTTDLLTAVNAKREILSLAPLAVFEAATSVKDGLTTLATKNSQSNIPIDATLADLKATNDQLSFIKGEDYKKSCTKAADAVAAFEKLASDANGTTRESLLQNALALFDEHECPVCETAWQPDKFREVVHNKLEKLKQITKARNDATAQLNSLLEPLVNLSSSLSTLVKPAGLLNPKIDVAELQAYVQQCNSNVNQFRKLFPVADTASIINKVQTIPAEVTSIVARIEKAISAIPAPTKQDAARDFLVAAQERIEVYRQSSQKHKKAEDRAHVAAEVYRIYNETNNKELEKIYKNVEQSFIEMYRKINADEEKFKAQLTPSAGKLGFDVDFYGRGFFPPGAYHSEGHQDGMGLCLYLALMDDLLKDNFTFAVLDDVLMSVDAGHRREVTKMLKEKFPHVQFIMTTHDEIWLRTMKSIGLITSKSFVHFRKWTVDFGPTEWAGRDIWQELNDYLVNNDVRAAAALLRHYLEYISQEICHNLRAEVEFRGDAQFMLGDLLPNALSALSKNFKKGKAAAHSWGQTAIFDKISAQDAAFTAAKTASMAEQWQINPAVHYNNWVNFTKADFEPVVVSFKDVLTHFYCSTCNELLYLMPERTDSENLRCSCSDININLVPKPKEAKSAANS